MKDDGTAVCEIKNMRYLNVGCGDRHRADWCNIDVVARDGVLAHDLRKGLPFPDETFDVVYHSHALEHFSKQDALPFIKECNRVLKINGILRVVVPDLELLVKNYLGRLEAVRLGSYNEYVNYEWTVIHLLDQLVRTSSGGEMATFLKDRENLDIAYVIKTCGDEVADIASVARAKKARALVIQNSSYGKGVQRDLASTIHNGLVAVRSTVYRLFCKQDPDLIKQIIFRNSGEVHKWMYDELSLKMLLRESGFRNICRKTASESAIQNWSSFLLDTGEDGTVHHPDSLFMEAIAK